MELEQTIRDWDTPEWAIPAVAAWIRSGGAIDRDLWIALRAAAREAAYRRTDPFERRRMLMQQ